MKIKIGVFEDHPIIQASIAYVFKQSQSNFDVLFIATTKEEFFERLKEHVPDVLLVDVIAEEVSGLEVFEHLEKNYSTIKSIAFTSLSSPILVENLLYLGVKGYVNKKQPSTDIINAVERVYNNEIILPDEYSFLTKRYYELHSSTLSPREIEIVRYISKEYTSAEIAEILSLSVNTVENHRKSIFAKLDVKNVAGLVREAATLGYL